MEITVVDAVENRRFEAYLDGVLAGYLDYRAEDDGRLALTYAKTLDGFSGLGVASAIATHALDAIRANGGTVHPACGFVADFIHRHPEYADLVAR